MKKAPRRIVLTAEWLERQHPCNDQEALALLYFGRRVVLTRTVLLEMAALGLNLGWLALRLVDMDLIEREVFYHVIYAYAPRKQIRLLATALGLP